MSRQAMERGRPARTPSGRRAGHARSSLLCLGLLAGALSAAPLTLRVGLTHAAVRVGFPGAIAFVGPTGDTEVHRELAVTVAPGGRLRAGGLVLPAGTVFRAPDSQPVALQLGYQPGQVGATRHWRGAVRLTVAGGHLGVINLVDTEAYVQGVVPCELGSTAPPAALAAQAVAARTYALVRRGAGLAPECDLEVALTQVYRGVDAETPATNAAVAATRGQVAVLDGKRVETVYSTCCGGVTASEEGAWGHPGAGLVPVIDGPDARLPRLDELQLRAVLDAPDEAVWCARHPLFRWQRTLSLAQLGPRVTAWLARYQPATKLGALRGVSVAERTADGRCAELRLEGALGCASVRGDRARWVFGEGDQSLPSTLFVLTTAGDTLTVNGGGYGHGVGLCQAGAATMARAGHGLEAIIAHYYGGARLVAEPDW